MRLIRLGTEVFLIDGTLLRFSMDDPVGNYLTLFVQESRVAYCYVPDSFRLDDFCDAFWKALQTNQPVDVGELLREFCLVEVEPC